jgi:prepilin-type N-terminal cleavage/methylation domain-containing protein
MTQFRGHRSGFSLLELLMAMALFAIAAVSLAQAINMISLTVSESIEGAEVREQMRAFLLEVSRDPDLREDSRETNPDDFGLFFRIEIVPLNLENQDAEPLANLFDVRVTALRKTIAKGVEELDVANTWVYPDIF